MNILIVLLAACSPEPQEASPEPDDGNETTEGTGEGTGGSDSGQDDSGGEDSGGDSWETPDISTIVASAWEARLDMDGDGIYDHYWQTAGDDTSGCTLSLLALGGKSLWTTPLPSCALSYAPQWHWRSFMGDVTRDFTLIVHQGGDELDYWLFAGDGATGALRDWSLDMGDGVSAGTIRLRGVATVDYQLADHDGPSLLVRTTGLFHGRLFHFPDDSNDAAELSADSTIIDASQPFAEVPWPGADLTSDAYTGIYNGFNWDLDPCAAIDEVSHYNCGVPDETGGGGYFLDKLAVGDLDGDGVEDAHMTYLWRTVVYPGRPKGQEQWLGAPQYDLYYNPQDDGSYCHSGRHYGLSVLVQTDDDAALEVADLSGTPVDNFVDIYQNVSRNIALQDAAPHATLPTTARSLAFNLPRGTMVPTCPGESEDDRLYDGVLHIPAEGRLEDDDGRTAWLLFNEFSQTSAATACPQNDFDCYTDQLQSMTGSWTFHVVDAQTGEAVLDAPQSYVWDLLVGQDGETWAVVSTASATFNLGAASFTDTAPQLRDDLSVARVDPEAGTLVDFSPIALPVKPLLLYTHWQVLDGTAASNFNHLRLALLDEGPSFLVRTETGFVRVRQGADGTWAPSDTYDSSGVAQL